MKSSKSNVQNSMNFQTTNPKRFSIDVWYLKFVSGGSV